jgi:hypothetical protein
MTPAKRKALEAAGYKIYDDPEEMLTDVMGPMPMPPEREAIRKRREACMRSRASIQVEFYRQMGCNLTCMEYVQAECKHPPKALEKHFRYSHFVAQCKDCGKEIK